MPQLIRRFSGIAVAAAVCWLIGGLLVIRAAPVDVITAAAQQGGQSFADGPVRRARTVVIAADVLPDESRNQGQTSSIRLDLFDDVSVVAVFERFDPNPAGTTWVGHVDGVAGSVVTLAYGGGLLVGSVALPGATYTIRPAAADVRASSQAAGGSAVHVVAEVDQAGFRPEALPLEEELPRDATPDRGEVQADSAEFIDLLVVYTPAAMAYAGGTSSAIANLIALGVSESNTAYANSGATQRLRLAQTALVSHVESSDASATLTNLRNGAGAFSGVAALRDAAAADLVMLVQTSSSSACGIAYLMTTPSTSFASLAFSVVEADCISPNYTFAHELGHNMGLRHDWYIDSATTPYSYAHGHVNTGVSGHRWRTIMSYNDLCVALGFSCQRLLAWSNPTVLRNGVPTGIPAGTKTSCTAGSTTANTCDADERQALNNTAPFVANFRQSVVPAPGAFSKTAPANGATGQPTSLTLTWGASSGATGYELCLDATPNTTCDGAWAAIGNVTSWPLSGLTPGATYSWHVRAVNGEGPTYAQASATAFWSFTVGAVTPPGAFSKTAPANGATGQPTSLTLTWGASSGASGYELCLDVTVNAACDGAWSAIGNVTSWPLNGLTPGVTYTWQVRALNAGGTTAANGGTWWTFVPGPAGPRSADFNGDGKPELVFQNAQGQVYAWFLNGLAFQSGAWLAQDTVGSDWKIVGTSDLSGDQKADLLWQQQTTGAVTLQTYDGTTRTGDQTISTATNTPWRIMATGDFNGDGRADLVWQNATSGQVYVWFMTVTGGSLAAFDSGAYVTLSGNPVTLNPTARTEWRIAGAGDVNGDGQRDLVWRNTVTGAVTVWLLNGTTFTGSLDWGTVNLAWQLRAVGDYYGDTAPDLVWQHTGTGEIYLWVRQGGALMPNTSVGTTSLAWQIVGAK